MGRSDRHHHKKKESKEERLLRKAKDYVKETEEKEKRKRKRHDDDKEEDDRHHKHSSSSRKHSRTSSKHHKRESKHHKKKASKKDKKRDKSRTKKKKPDKSKLTNLGQPLGHAPSTLLDADRDYFQFHKALFVYLFREHGLAFNDLSSDETHEYFAEFVERYNSGSLEAAYYDAELPPSALEEIKTTEHKWSFQTSATEQDSLNLLQEGVRKQTEYASGVAAAPESRRAEQSASNKRPAPSQETAEPKRRSAEDRYTDRVMNRRLKEHVRTAEEEFGGGRKEGRERQLEKRREVGERTHAAARDREAAGVELTDEALFGGGGAGGKDDFQAALAREKQRKSRREEKRNTRVEELQKKETQKQQDMLKMLGLSGIKPGEKIKIAPRNPPS